MGDFFRWLFPNGKADKKDKKDKNDKK